MEQSSYLLYIIYYMVIQQILEPQLVDQNILKKILRNSYNESSNPFIELVNKYSKNILSDNCFIILVLFLILFIAYHVYKKRMRMIKQYEIEKQIRDKLISEEAENEKKREKAELNKKKYDKYNNPSKNNINDYYTKKPQIL